MKVRIDRDEYWPFFTIEELNEFNSYHPKSHIEISRSELLEFQNNLNEMKKIQDKLEKLYNANNSM